MSGKKEHQKRRQAVSMGEEKENDQKKTPLEV